MLFPVHSLFWIFSTGVGVNSLVGFDWSVGVGGKMRCTGLVLVFDFPEQGNPLGAEVSATVGLLLLIL